MQPVTRMKLNCIIDTCSCINLSNTEYLQEPLLKYLNDEAHLNYSNEVHIELRDHKDKNLPTFIHEKRRKLKVGKQTMNEYERRMLGAVIPSRKKKGNKGEVDNFLASVDQIHHVKKNSVIFITDDENATNGIFATWTESFPVIKVWSSYEVVLFLYAEKIIPSKDIAINLVKDLVAFTSPIPSKRSEETTTKLTKLLKRYYQRIENISKLLN